MEPILAPAKDMLDPEIVTVQGKVTGLIYPPPDIRAIVDKTAQFVARNGRNFERRLAGETNSNKFSFLKSSDPYHNYYEHKVNEFAEKDFVSEETTPAKPSSTAETPTSNALPDKTTVIEKKAIETLTSKVSKRLKEKDIAPPLPEMYKIYHPSLSALDQEIMLLTAQYTAHNGKSFLAGLATREQRNPQFDFLRPTHALFAYFTALVESYSHVLLQDEQQMQRIEEGMDRMKVLDRCVHRMEYMREEHEKQAKETAENDAERLALAQIDWHDFIIVETIRFDDEENDKMHENAVSVDVSAAKPATSDDDMDMEDDSDPEHEESNIKVVEDYVPMKENMTGSQISAQPMMTVDGKTISPADANEHMRILLMNPKWREESQRHLEKQRDSSFAVGSAIADSLKRFATKRSDIFSSSAEEEARILENEKQREIQRNEFLAEQATEHANTLLQQRGQTMNDMTFPPPNAFQHTQHVMPETMWHGNRPPPNAYPPPMMQVPPGMAPPVMHLPPGISQGPPGAMPNLSMPLHGRDGDNDTNKRQKTEASLLPENDFAALHPGTLLLSVKVPLDSSNDQWKLQGQTIGIEVDVKDTMRIVKEKLTEQLGMPVNKQQLKASFGYLKDTLSSAHYNFVNGTSIELSVRQRGGRR